MQIYKTVTNSMITSVVHNTASFNMELRDSAKNIITRTIKEAERMSTKTVTSDMTDRDTQKVTRNTTKVLVPISMVTAAQTVVNAGYKHELHKLQSMENALANKTINGVSGIQAINAELNAAGLGLQPLSPPSNIANKLLNGTKPIDIINSAAMYQVSEFNMSGITGKIKLTKGADGTFRLSQANNANGFAGTTGKVYRRNVVEFKREGQKIKFSNLGERAGGGVSQAGSIVYMNEYYKTICKVSGRNQNVVLAKEMDNIAKQAKKVDHFKAGYQTLMNPKRLTRMVTGIAMTPLNNSEAGQGMGLTQSVYGGVKLVGHTAKNPVINLSLNTVRGAYKHYEMIHYYYKNLKTNNTFQSLSFHKKYRLLNKHAEQIVNQVGFKKVPLHKIGSKNQMIYTFIRKIRMKANTNVASLFLKSDNMFAQYAGKRILSEAILTDGFEKEMGKEARKGVKKYLREELIHEFESKTAAGMKINTGKNTINQTTNNIRNKLINSAVGKLVKDIKNKIQNSFIYQATAQIRAQMAQAFAKLGEKLIEILAPIAKFIGITLLIIVVLVLIMQLMLVVLKSLEAEDETLNRYTLSSSAEFLTRADAVMNSVKTSHTSMVNTLKARQQSYDTADIEYPTGTQENYKEIFCAIETMMQYNNTFLTTSEVQDIADYLYDKTHIVTESPYDYYDADGTLRHACHIFVEIQRDETLAYECMDGFAVASARSGAIGITGTEAPVSGSCVAGDWLNIVRSVKSCMAASGQIYYGDGGSYFNMTMNGTTYSVRPDCSGYVSACLQVYGSFGMGYSPASGSFVNFTSITGFTKHRWSGWNNLQEGDILAVNGHVEIFAYNANGRHYVYNAGSTNSVRAAGVTCSGHSSYSYYYRPEDAGTGETFDPSIEPPQTEVGGITRAMITSNTLSVTFNPDTGNEDGYESALVADINAQMASTSYFTNVKYDTAYKDHSLTASSSKSSSIDFVRYIFAKHGGDIAFNDDKAIELGEIVLKPDALVVGDLLWYVPHTLNTDMIAAVKDISEIG